MSSKEVREILISKGCLATEGVIGRILMDILLEEREVCNNVTIDYPEQYYEGCKI